MRADLKIILVGDSAVGKSKLIERYLVHAYEDNTSSTRAVSLFQYATQHPLTGAPLCVDFVDTAGQERFASMHAAYYYGAHACLLCFDLTRRETYKNLENWYRELRRHRPKIPVLVVANKVDLNEVMDGKSFKFALDNCLEVRFVSACDGRNVANLFADTIAKALRYKESENRDFIDDVLDLLCEF